MARTTHRKTMDIPVHILRQINARAEYMGLSATAVIFTAIDEYLERHADRVTLVTDEDEAPDGNR